MVAQDIECGECFTFFEVIVKSKQAQVAQCPDCGQRYLVSRIPHPYGGLSSSIDMVRLPRKPLRKANMVVTGILDYSADDIQRAAESIKCKE